MVSQFLGQPMWLFYYYDQYRKLCRWGPSVRTNPGEVRHFDLPQSPSSDENYSMMVCQSVGNQFGSKRQKVFYEENAKI